MKTYYSINDLINMIDSPNREICNKILSDNLEIFNISKGSKTKHQAWEGGYLDHITETMNLAIIFYNSLNELRKLPFNLSDSLLILFLHDIEKPWKQSKDFKSKFEDKNGIKDEKAITLFKEELLKKYNIKLNEMQLNALKYVEGEGNDYDPFKRVSNELAAFCHICDVWSARGWHDFPKSKELKW